MSEIVTTGALNIITIILAHTGLAASTKQKYCRAVEGYLATGASLTDADALAAHAAAVSASVRGNLKSALRLWIQAVKLKLKATATPEAAHQVQAALWRLEALEETIKVKPVEGQKSHTWLSQLEVKRLLATCNEATLLGRRDQIVLGILTGAGLRREELAGLEFRDIQLLPRAGRFRTVLNVRGKGAKDRTVPINDKLAAALDVWRATAGGAGRVARAISQQGELEKSISAVGIFKIVAKAGEAIGKPQLAPHDLRRTYAQLGYEAGIPITQISLLLGHANVATTQRYLRLDLKLDETISDFIPFAGD